MHFFKDNNHRQQEQAERSQYEKRTQHEQLNRMQGFNNPMIEDTNYSKPIPKKDFLKTLERMEATSKDPETRAAAGRVYVHTKKYTSESGTK